MERIKVIFKFSEIDPWNEIAIASLADFGFDSFLELDNGIEAYID